MEKKLFEEELRSLGLRGEFKKLVAVISVISFAIALIELFLLKLSFEFLTLIFFTTLAFPPLLFYFYLDYLQARKQKQIDAALPAALFQIASFPKRTSMEKIIRSIAESDYGPLSKEFARAHKQVVAGMPVADALEALRARNKSLLLGRAISLLLKSYKSGADLSPAFKEVAEDAFELQALMQESSSAMAMQKYTLLAGGGVLVPIILGLLLNVVAALNVGDVEFIGGASAEARQALSNALLLGNQVYLTIFAAMASSFIAFSEHNAKKAVLYFALLFPIALLLFNIVRGAPIIP